MIWFGLLIIALISFSGVLLVGAPYLPTLSDQQKTAFKLLNLKRGDTLIELGCGDGKVVVAAARQGINVVGYELNPLLFMVSYLRTWRYRAQVRIVWGNFWTTELPKAQAIYVFLLPKYMEKLNDFCESYQPKPLKLVSIAFEIKSKKPAKTSNGVFFYKYGDKS